MNLESKNVVKEMNANQLKLECDNLVDYKNKMKHLYSCHATSKGMKKLYIKGNGEFTIELNDEIIFECIQAFVAIEKFYEE